MQRTMLAYPTSAPRPSHPHNLAQRLHRATVRVEKAITDLPLRDRCLALNIALTQAMQDWQAQQNYDDETKL